MDNVPALGLPARLPDLLSRSIIGMNLHRKFFLGKEELQQQREAMIIPGRLTDKLAPVLRRELRKPLARQSSVPDEAVVARQPGLADLLLKLAGVNWRKVKAAP